MNETTRIKSVRRGNNPVASLILGAICLAGTIWIIYYLPDLEPWNIYPPIMLAIVVIGFTGLMLGVSGLNEAMKQRTRGRVVLAMAGIGTLLVALLVCFLHLSSKSYIPSWRMRSANQLKQIGIALHNYDPEKNQLPAWAIRDKEGERLLSWRVSILPYVDQDKLFQQFRLDEPWYSTHNAQLLDTTVVFHTRLPNRADSDIRFTYYQAFVGKGTAFEPDRPVTFAEIAKGDGTENTLLVAEADIPVIWAKPEDLPYHPDKPLPRLGRLWADGTVFNGLFADGSVRWLRADMDEKVLRALITRNGGEKLDPSQLGE